MIENDRDRPDLSVGVKFRQVFRVWILSMSTRGEVTCIQENQELELLIRHSGCVTRCHYTLTRKESGRTQVVQAVELKPALLFSAAYWLLRYPVRWLVRGQAIRNLDRLKSACESSD